MNRSQIFALVILGASLGAVRPGGAVEKNEVEQAVQRGVRYLKDQQFANGTWGHIQIGATALAGLALLECDVPANDPVIEKAAQAVRQASVDLTSTYSLSLSILFLDRLGEAEDVPLIESMTARLLAGQAPQDGGWGYGCPLVGDKMEEQRLRTVLDQRAVVAPGRPAPPPAGDRRRDGRTLDVPAKNLMELARRQRGSRMVYSTDNSNTQFALFALWVARRHGLPVEGALTEVGNRFRRSQMPDGTWGYMLQTPPPAFRHIPQPMIALPGGPSPAMTCAGLVGLATANGVRAVLKARAEGPQTAPAGHRKAEPPPSGPEAAVRKGLLALSHAIGQPTGDPSRVMPPPFYGNGGKLYYYLWSLERVAMAFGLETIGKKDWYNWGAEVLLVNQNRSGGWTNGHFNQGECDTSFALLFLRRANLASDLTRSLQGQFKDPGRVELTGGRVGPSGLPKVTNPFANPPSETGLKDPGDNPGSPPDNPVNEADRLGMALVSATGKQQDLVLDKLRQGKGSAFTAALAQAIAKMEGGARQKAREALAERLARMNSSTLGEKLQDEDLEIRRAAALACAMRDDKTHFAKLIGLLQDPEPPVARAAQAALKSLSNQDLGPPEDASRAEKAKAVEAWKAWWEKNGKK